MTETRRPGGAAQAGPRASRVWWLAFVVILAVLGMLWGWMSQRPPEAYAPLPSAGSQTPTIPQIARQQVWISDTKASGVYLSNTIALEPAVTAPDVIPYSVQVEDTTGLDADEVAREVQATLDDERGWVGYGKRTFRLVSDTAAAKLTIYVTSPETANDLCKPADVASKWNCHVGDRVVLNADRWKYMTPTYDDLGAYRSYAVNHEVGHFLGLGHVGCPKTGGPAPVMMQQGIELASCTPNAWPRDAD